MRIILFALALSIMAFCSWAQNAPKVAPPGLNMANASAETRQAIRDQEAADDALAATTDIMFENFSPGGRPRKWYFMADSGDMVYYFAYMRDQRGVFVTLKVGIRDQNSHIATSLFNDYYVPCANGSAPNHVGLVSVINVDPNTGEYIQQWRSQAFLGDDALVTKDSALSMAVMTACAVVQYRDQHHIAQDR